MDSLTPAQRSLRARAAAFHLHATHDSRALTENARAAGPGRIDYWMRQVDPDGTLPEAERRRRAEHAKRAHYLNLALKSAVARRRRAS